MDSLIGTVVAGRFEVLRLLGRGGMGRIYEVELKQLKKRFAIKVLAKELAGKEDALLRFRREAEIVASLKHPNIIEIVDWATLDDGRPLYVMELLEGEDLEQHLKANGPLPWEDIAAIASQSVSALLVAHDKGILHRDLKPTNIFLLNHGSSLQVKIIDFGLAKARDLAAITMYTSPKLIGTPAYMSPGQLDGRTAVGEEADCWSMAAVLYEAATGKQAFHGAFAELYYMIGKRRPVPVGVLRPDTPPAFADAIAAALTPAEDRRITSLEELGDRIANSLLGHGGVAVKASLKSLARSSTRDERKKEAPQPDTLPWGATVEDAEPAGLTAGKAKRPVEQDSAASAGDEADDLPVKDTLPWGASAESANPAEHSADVIERDQAAPTEEPARTAQPRTTQRVTKAQGVPKGKRASNKKSEPPEVEEEENLLETRPWGTSGDEARSSSPAPWSTNESSPSGSGSAADSRSGVRPTNSQVQIPMSKRSYGIWLAGLAAAAVVVIVLLSTLGDSGEPSSVASEQEDKEKSSTALVVPADASMAAPSTKEQPADASTRDSAAAKEPSEADPEAELGTLRMTSKPTGAEVGVFLEGRQVFRGITPVSAQLPPGSYMLMSDKPGYFSYQPVVDVIAKEEVRSHAILKQRPKRSVTKPSPRKKGVGDNNMAPTF